jgi:hypothetical protein
MPFNIPSSNRRMHDRASGSTTDSTSPHPTPSRSSESSDDLPLLNEPNTYELQPISHSIPPSPIDEDDEDQHNARRLSFDSVQSYELYTPDEDRTVRRKLDRKLVGFMALLYCLSFLDRTSEWFSFVCLCRGKRW